MVRDPLALVSSNYAEWFCQLGHWETQAKKFGLPPSAASRNDSCPYTLEDRTQARILFIQNECQNLSKSELSSLRGQKKERCMAHCLGQADPTSGCASIPAFLKSDKFPRFFTNLYKDQTNSNKPNATADDYIYGALEYSGGLDTSVEDKEGDMMWFGITERIEESMCLFHYQTGLPLVDMPRNRIKQCQPTSFWAEGDKERYRSSQILDHAVYYAANAILDLQLAKMRQILWSRVLEGNVNVTDMNFTSLDCMGLWPQ